MIMKQLVCKHKYVWMEESKEKKLGYRRSMMQCRKCEKIRIPTHNELLRAHCDNFVKHGQINPNEAEDFYDRYER